MRTLRNPTDEVLEYMHGGKNFIFQPGCDKPGKPLTKIEGATMYEIPDSSANHLITQIGQRGLIELKFEDLEDPKLMTKKIEDALERQRKFETKQIEKQNQVNQRQKNKHRDYVDPDEQIKKWSIKYGIKLDQPYNIRDEETEAIARAEKKAVQAELKSSKLEDDLSEVKDMMAMLMEEKIARDIIPKYDGRSKERIELEKLMVEGDYKGAISLHKKYQER